jgi:hypothetical protein
MPAQIAALGKGNSLARVRRFDGNQCRLRDRTQEWLQATHDTLMKAAKRASEHSSFTYKVERGEFRTSTGEVVTCVIVTRTE